MLLRDCWGFEARVQCSGDRSGAASWDQWSAFGSTVGRGSSRTNVRFTDLHGSPSGPADPGVRPTTRAADPVAGAPIEPDQPMGDARDGDRAVRHACPLAKLFPPGQVVADPAHAQNSTVAQRPSGRGIVEARRTSMAYRSLDADGGRAKGQLPGGRLDSRSRRLHGNQVLVIAPQRTGPRLRQRRGRSGRCARRQFGLWRRALIEQGRATGPIPTSAFPGGQRDRLLAEAEVLLVGYPVPPRLADRALSLRWAHHTQAGVSNLLQSDLWTSSVPLTSSRGAVAVKAIAEFVMAGVYHFARGLRTAMRRGGEPLRRDGYDLTSVAGATLGVVGLGGIGQEVARLGRAVGMRVIGAPLKRRLRNGPALTAPTCFSPRLICSNWRPRATTWSYVPSSPTRPAA